MRKNYNILILKEYELHQDDKCFKSNFRLIFKPYRHCTQETVTSREFFIFGEVLFQIKYDGKLEVRFSQAFPPYPRTVFFDVYSSKLKINNMLFCTDDSWHFLSAEHFDIKLCRHTVELSENYTEKDSKYFDISIHLKSVQQSPLPFVTLHDDKELVDLELRGVDGSVLVHKAVLAGCSTVFRQELSAQYVQVQHATQKTLQQLKDFIYLRVLPDDMDNLLRIASRYMISDLEYSCTVKLLTTISAETVPKLLELALLNNQKLLMQGVLLSVKKVKLDDTDEHFAFQGYITPRIDNSEFLQNGNVCTMKQSYCFETSIKTYRFPNEWYWYVSKRSPNFIPGSKVAYQGWSGYKYNESKEYLMCGLLLVQIKAEWILMEKFLTATISLKALDLNKVHNTIVTINVFSEAFDVNKSFDVDDNEWKLIGEVATDFTNDLNKYSFEVTIELNIKDCIPPVFANLHNDKELVDLELRGVDGSVLVHKAVLAGCSTVFRQEPSTQYVQVQHATQLTLQQLKDFIYLRVLPDDMDKVVEIASFYKIEGFELQCIVKLLNTVTVENVCKFLRFAIRYEMKELLLVILKSVQRGAILIEDIVKDLYK